jgi:hypothetical protein
MMVATVLLEEQAATLAAAGMVAEEQVEFRMRSMQ